MSDRRDFIRHAGALAISLPVLPPLIDFGRIGPARLGSWQVQELPVKADDEPDCTIPSGLTSGTASIRGAPER